MKQLDGLRALAVFAVLWTHYVPPALWPLGLNPGHFGVQLFFVLSGFLITGILLQERSATLSGPQTMVTALRQFYLRRFLRIFPLFYAVLLVAFLVNIPLVRESLPWHVFYLSNVYLSLRTTGRAIFLTCGRLPLKSSSIWSGPDWFCCCRADFCCQPSVLCSLWGQFSDGLEWSPGGMR